MPKTLLMIVAAVILSGCGADFTSIYRDYSVVPSNKTTTVVIDAKQRAIISTPNTVSNSNRTAFVCAEPSPDALSAISASFAGGVGLARPDREERIALSSAIQEAAKQLGTRNATIQLLRDGLYRQCEAYMNGLISDETYDQIANKYINAMVVLLAVEQITTPVPATIQGGEEVVSDGAVTTEVNVSVPRIERQKETDQESSETPKTPADAEVPKDGTQKEATEGSTADTTHGDSPGEPSGSQGTPNAPGQPDQAGDTSKPPSDTEEPEGEERTEITNNSDSSGDISASGAAGSPTVSVQIPRVAGSGVSDSVAAAVREMTHMFLRKDTVDFCLYTLPRLAEGSSSEAKNISRTLVDGFVGVCNLIIATEYTGGTTLPTNIFDFLKKEAEIRDRLSKAGRNIPTELPRNPDPPTGENPEPPPTGEERDQG